MTENELREKIELYTRACPSGSLQIFSDTTQFMEIGPGALLEISGRHYYVYGEETEGRFGIDDQPKFWVKRVLDLADGSRKIVKLAFLESFVLNIGDFRITCYRSPAKEARVLDLTRGDIRFMQGFSAFDSAQNLVRVLDRILGKSLYAYINSLQEDHKTYFFNIFPRLFPQLVSVVQALSRLHAAGEIHGDMRNDHVFLDREAGVWRLIDFDYAYDRTESPFAMDLYGLGNVLLFATGKGFFQLNNLTACLPRGFSGTLCLEPEDFSLFFAHRIMNLRKIFPYIPESLNDILLHFSEGARYFYERADEVLADLLACAKDLPPAKDKEAARE
ncbi:MAG: serine/threonine protein kinase [Thermodesulfobacteriota bacterium]